MSIEIIKIIKNNNGKIKNTIKNSIQSLTEYEIECENNHIFSVTEDDLREGEWCRECNNIIFHVLNEMKIEYKRDFNLNNITYPVIINKTLVSFSDEKDVLEEEKLTAETYEYTFLNIPKEDRYKKQSLYKYFQKEEKIKIGKDSYLKKINDIEENRGLGYIRVSTDIQAKSGFSLIEQENTINKELKARGITPCRFYIDEGITASKNDDKRVGFVKLIEDAKKGDTIIVKSLSRFSRRLKNFLIKLDELKEKGVRVIFLDYDFDTNTMIGNFTINLLANIAELESKQTGKRVSDIMQDMKENGRLKTKPPIGFKMPKDKKDLNHIVDEKEMKVVGLIFRLRNQLKYTIPEIIKYLEENNYTPFRKSTKWHKNLIRRILEKEIYLDYV